MYALAYPFAGAGGYPMQNVGQMYPMYHPGMPFMQASPYMAASPYVQASPYMQPSPYMQTPSIIHASLLASPSAQRPLTMPVTRKYIGVPVTRYGNMWTISGNVPMAKIYTTKHWY